MKCFFKHFFIKKTSSKPSALSPCWFGTTRNDSMLLIDKIWDVWKPIAGCNTANTYQLVHHAAWLHRSYKTNNMSNKTEITWNQCESQCSSLWSKRCRIKRGFKLISKLEWRHAQKPTANYVDYSLIAISNVTTSSRWHIWMLDLHHTIANNPSPASKTMANLGLSFLSS